MFDPELEARVVAAVRTALSSPRDEDAATHQLCEATNALLDAFLKLSDDWPDDRFIDGLVPLEVQGGEGQLELAAAAIVTDPQEEERWVVQPLIAHFVIEADALADVSLLFAYADREPLLFDAAAPELSLEFPADADGFLYRLSTAPAEEDAQLD